VNAERLLVTGANGYIAGRLIPRLLNGGARVRVLVRDPHRLSGRRWFQAVEPSVGDVLHPESLRASLEGVRTAYYLIHNMALGKGYIAREREGARAFGEAARELGVRHIIYLGGLADPRDRIAAHLRSRIETGEILRASGVPVTEFRAGTILGSGSISFEMIRFITEQFPLLPGPNWLRNRTQPIAATNVLDYLTAAVDRPDGGIFEIGGPEVMTYAESMRRYAKLRGLRRVITLVPALPVDFMAWWVDRLTPVPFPIARALVDGLRADSIVKDDAALRSFPSVNLIRCDDAISQALNGLHPDEIERVWDVESQAVSLKHEGFLIDHRRGALQAPAARVWAAVTNRLDSGVERADPGRRILLYARAPFHGRQWMEWSLGSQTDGTELTFTSYYSARGLPGHLYWYLTAPWRRWRFSARFADMARRARLPEALPS